MPNKIFEDILGIEVEKLKAEYKAIGQIKHNPTKGTLREYGIGSLIKKYLPSVWDIGEGIIVDSWGNQSNQIDLIIYKKDVLPSIMFGASVGIFPIESVAFAIEIKSKTTKTEIEKTINNMRQFKNLRTIDNICAYTYCKKCYFSYSTDLNEKNEFERFIETAESPYLEPELDIICVLGDGYYYFKDKNNNKCKEKKYTIWQGKKANNKDIELKLFIIGIVNSVTGNYKFGYYSLKDDNMDYYYYKDSINNLEIKMPEINIFNTFMNYLENNEHESAIEYLKKNNEHQLKQKLIQITYTELKKNNDQRYRYYEKELSK